jgi:hypothetical protein
MTKEKQLTIKLLTEKLEKISGKKIKLSETRSVYKTAEFEEIDSAIQTIRDNAYVFKNAHIRNNIGKMLGELERLVKENGVKEIA